jgi:toluene monooxygenase system protein D
MKNAVGPVLRMSDDIDAIIAAIEDDNPGTEIEVIDRGAYVRIQAEQRMKVTRASIERHIGRTFEMRQLEPMMSAFAGRIETTSEAILWSYRQQEGLVS